MSVPGTFFKAPSYLMQLSLALVLILASTLASANPLVRVHTTFGDFTVELLEDEAPQTVANFLNYLDRGDYAGMFVHRRETNFVLQTGGFHFVPFRGPVTIPQDPPVVNEPGVSNTRGTLAMAKLGNDPNSATSQWFINLADNTQGDGNLDEQNGGFTVFGRVLGDGMSVVDAIAAINTFSLDGGAGPFGQVPLRGYTGLSAGLPLDRNFIKFNPVRVVRHSGAQTVFESATGRLNVWVDAGEDLGHLSLHMYLIAEQPELIFEVDQRSVIEMAVSSDETAVFDEASGVLEVPRVEANLSGNIITLSNLVFRMIDEEQLRFVLESWDE
jgi:peptidyl-prolyl cis-trans isomerase A (cyclophilin A)